MVTPGVRSVFHARQSPADTAFEWLHHRLKRSEITSQVSNIGDHQFIRHVPRRGAFAEWPEAHTRIQVEEFDPTNRDNRLRALRFHESQGRVS